MAESKKPLIEDNDPAELNKIVGRAHKHNDPWVWSALLVFVFLMSIASIFIIESLYLEPSEWNNEENIVRDSVQCNLASTMNKHQSEVGLTMGEIWQEDLRTREGDTYERRTRLTGYASATVYKK